MMKLGGCAHTKGITFFCDVFKIKATQKGDEICYTLEWILPGRKLQRLANNPLGDGLLTMYYQWKIMSNKMKILFLTMIVLMIVDELIYIPLLNRILYLRFHWLWIMTVSLILILINIKKIIMLFRYHGAEHKVINCYFKYGYVDRYLVSKTSRFSKRCGSNLAAVFLILYVFFWIFEIDSILLLFVLFLISIKVVKYIASKDFRGDQYINLLQWITVLEPTQEQIDFTIKIFYKLQHAYSVYQNEMMRQSQKIKS